MLHAYFSKPSRGSKNGEQQANTMMDATAADPTLLGIALTQLQTNSSVSVSAWTSEEHVLWFAFWVFFGGKKNIVKKKSIGSLPHQTTLVYSLVRQYTLVVTAYQDHIGRWPCGCVTVINHNCWGVKRGRNGKVKTVPIWTQFILYTKSEKQGIKDEKQQIRGNI